MGRVMSGFGSETYNLKGMPSAKTCETNKGSQCKQDMSKM